MSTHDDPKYQSGPPPEPRKAPEGVIVSTDTWRDERLPPSQSRTRKWPVLHYGRVPLISHEEWRLDVTGLVERPLRFSWDEFQRLPRVRVFADFHCVTRWSHLGNVWEGVLIRTLFEQAGIEFLSPLSQAV